MTKCTVQDGLFVIPCDGLAKATDIYLSAGRAKGIFKCELTNMQTGKPARSYFGIRSNEFRNGLCFNFCPFCGVDISAPFQPEEEQQEPRQ